MIIEPDFPDHWKTKMFVQLTGNKLAPMALIRLWCHCHARKTCWFEDLTEPKLAAICQWDGDAAELLEAMLKSGFLVREDDGALYVHDWDIVNASLVANWTNGPKGGRPKKYSPETQEKPADNPTETQQEPTDNPSVSDGLDRGKGRNRKKGEKGAKRRTEKIVLTNDEFFELQPKGFEPVILFGASLKISEVECRKFFEYNKRRKWGALTDGTHPKNRVGWRQLLELWQKRVEERDAGKIPAKNSSVYDLPVEFDKNKPNAHTGGLAFAPLS